MRRESVVLNVLETAMYATFSNEAIPALLTSSKIKMSHSDPFSCVDHGGTLCVSLLTSTDFAVVYFDDEAKYSAIPTSAILETNFKEGDHVQLKSGGKRYSAKVIFVGEQIQYSLCCLRIIEFASFWKALQDNVFRLQGQNPHARRGSTAW